MTQEQEWAKWRRQESNILGESIEWAADVFNSTDGGIEWSRHYGAALLAHSIECARAIRLCVERGLSGPAFSLARAQYEGALRGHIIIHEMELEELNGFFGKIQRWHHKRQTGQLPSIKLRRATWMCPGERTKPKWRPIRSEIAKRYVKSVGDPHLLHDLTHSGMTQALLMRDEDGYIGPNFSEENLTLLLCFADTTVMFAVMTWPGAEQKYCREIESRIERSSQLRSGWLPRVGTKIA